MKLTEELMKVAGYSAKTIEAIGERMLRKRMPILTELVTSGGSKETGDALRGIADSDYRRFSAAFDKSHFPATKPTSYSQRIAATKARKELLAQSAFAANVRRSNKNLSVPMDFSVFGSPSELTGTFNPDGLAMSLHGLKEPL